MSGGKGGSQTTQAQIPDWAKEPTVRNLQRAEDLQKVGYMPYYGADVAGFSPMEQQAMQNTMNQASAFGLAQPGANAMAGMPQTQMYDLGGGQQIAGYSAGNLYDQALAETQARNPEFAQRYDELFKG
jgi:hypothetical protein